MPTVSLKISDRLDAELTEEARKRRLSKSEFIRRSVESALNSKESEPSCLEAMGEWVGSFRGPGDLSTNRVRLEDAIAEDFERGRKSPR